MFEYIQSRYYRAPEVLVGSRYGPEIDMWSIGCIAAELYIGQPILPGSSEFDQLGKIVKLIGDVPEYIRKDSKNSRKYYIFDQHSKKHRIKTIGEYLKEFPNEPEPKYEIPLELSNLEELLIKNNKTNLNLSSNSLNSSYNDYNMESFINFLKGLLNPDPRQRWNAKQALRHPFITKEKFEGYFNPNTEETSQFLYRSIEVSQNSDRINYYIRKYPKSNMYHSMMYNINPYLSNNISCDHTTSFTNSSLETSCYQLNTNKIPLQMLKNFPYAKIDEINLKPNRGKEKCYNKFDNNTFMKTSYDQINQSFTSDHLFYGKKKRQVKDDLMTKDKNKFSKYSKVNEKSFGQNNNYNRNYFWMSIDHMNNKIDINQRQGLQIQGVNDKITSSGNNKSVFYKNKNKLNLKEYEGLMITNHDPNISIDYLNRTRSKSDYDQTYLNSNFNLGKNNFHTNNNLNFSNFSTYHIEKEKYKKDSQETPIITAKLHSKSEEKPKVKEKERENYSQMNNKEIKEEDQIEEEIRIKFSW